ncbi:MAG: hypothetical protein R3C42_09610 [Parvularculaceae bacterium]
MTQGERQFDLTLPEAAAAIGASPKRLRNLLDADEGIGLDEIQHPTIPGSAVMISPHALMRLTVACALADRGLTLRASLAAAASFAFIGEGVGYWEGEPRPAIPRWPSMCFPDGQTWLLVAEDETLIANIGGNIGRNCFKSIDAALKRLRFNLLQNENQRNDSRTEWERISRLPIVALELTGIDEWLDVQIRKILEERRPRNTRLRNPE